MYISEQRLNLEPELFNCIEFFAHSRNVHKPSDSKVTSHMFWGHFFCLFLMKLLKIELKRIL